MTHDVVALLDRRPTMRGMTRALVQSGPALRVRTVAEGAVVELRDDSGQLVAAAHAAQRLSVASEAERLLGGGIGDSLPAQPWWVEARGAETGPDGPDTAGMVRRFAESLVSEFGGRVWEPESRLVRDDPLLVGATDHPAVTLATENVALVVQDRPVVPLSMWLADAIAIHGRAGRSLQLVTPAESRLTHELSALLQNPMARWVVRAPGDDSSGGDCYDGHNGLPLNWDEQAGFVRDTSQPAERVPHPYFLQQPDDNEVSVDHLLIDLKVLHPADEDLRLAEEVELLTKGLTGGAPTLWGIAEPVSMVWNRNDVTALARRRAPGSSRFLFVGPRGSDYPFSGTLGVRRVDGGVKESVTLAVAHPPGVDPDLVAVTRLIRDLSVGGDMQMVNVFRRRGRSDLTRPPHPVRPLIPVGLGVGADGVSEVGLKHADSAPVEPVRFGPPLTPSLWYRFGGGTDPADRQRLRDLMAHLRPDANTVGA